MEVFKLSCFDDFHCIAAACPDSCCKEWAVQVDDAAAAYYRSLPGELGDKLRSVLKEEDGDTVMTIEDGRCPMWRADGLCRIHAELGEDALCKTCREFPRLRHDYGDFVELGLELSCPEAARLLLSSPDARLIRSEVPGGEAPEYDTEAMSVLKDTRQQVLEILNDQSRSVPEALALALLYGYQAQDRLDGGEEIPFDPDTALESVGDFIKTVDGSELLAFYQGLEILQPQWLQRLRHPLPGPWQEEYRALAQYFIQRYWLQAVSDYDLYSRVKFSIVSCLLIRLLGGDLLQTAQSYSKEIENDADNVDAILDAAYAHSAFTDDKVLGMLLS